MRGETGVALSLSLASAVALNWGYLREHDAAGALPPLTIRHPLHTARLLVTSRRWLTGFSAEMSGWGLFVLALALAPLALVQAVSAAGIGVLAALVSRFRLARLNLRERLGVLLSVTGLSLLGVSLAGGAGSGGEASRTSLGVWLAGSAAAAATAVRSCRAVLGDGAAFGLATGVAFAAGDVATKATVAGDLVTAPLIVAGYGVGTLLLQTGFQHGGALVTAGLATLLTNAIPIAAGMTIFHEQFPDQPYAALRLLAFASVVVSAAFLARPDTNRPQPPRPPIGPQHDREQEPQPTTYETARPGVHTPRTAPGDHGRHPPFSSFGLHARTTR